MQGQCLCGKVQFQLRSEIVDSYICHCRDCQLYSGSAFQTLAIVDKKDFEITSGKPDSFTHKTQDNSNLTRYFCSSCSSPLFNISSRFDEIVMFALSSLNESAKVSPSFQIWTTSKLPWVSLDSNLISYSFGAEDGDTPPV